MEQNKIVLRYKNNKVEKGKTSDFFPTKTQFHLEKINGEIVLINIEDLKAVYFVKDFKGNKNHQYHYNKEIGFGGRRVKVCFYDGEIVVGSTVGYSPERQGFFVIPSDLLGNNERIFVVKSATKKIEFLYSSGITNAFREMASTVRPLNLKIRR